MQEVKHPKYDFRAFFPAPWLAIWLWCMLAIIILGLATPLNFTLTFIKVGGIFLCFVYSLQRFPKDHLLHIAMLTTFIADIILAINNTAEGGVGVFLLAQIIHIRRLAGKRATLPLVIISGIALIFIGAAIIWQFIPVMFAICIFYIIAILTNIDISWRWCRHQRQNPAAICAFVGFILFLCCDLCTGISYMSLNHAFPYFLYAPANFLAWLFYYPSQVLVSNSSRLNQTSLNHTKRIKSSH